MGDQTINFLCVGRLSDKTVVAAYTHQKDGAHDFLKTAKQVLAAPAIASAVATNLHLNHDSHTVHVSVDTTGHVYLAITRATYPRRLMFKTDDSKLGLLTDLAAQFTQQFEREFQTCSEEGLNRKAAQMFKNLCAKYSDVDALDRIVKVHNQVNEVTSIMQDNVSKMMERGDRIEGIEGKTSELATSAQKFSVQATAVRRAMQWRYYKLQALCVLLILVVLAYILVPIIINWFG